MKKTKFTVACNWDLNLIECLKPYASHIKYIYGKTKTDVFSGGRAAKQVKESSERKFAENYIKKAKQNGLNFNYLLNGTKLNKEFSKETTKQIRENLDWIVSTGTKWVTLSNPRLAEIIKNDYPSLKVNVSIFAHVRTPKQAERWKKRGAKSICLDRSLVRNINQLKLLTKTNNIEYNLIVNDPCLLNCEKELYHDNMMCEASISKEKYFHFCSLDCLREFIKDPTEILKSTYIRPENIETYKKLGINHFKIVDRNRTTKFITNAVKAYVNKKYDGNLLDLMSLFSYYDRKPTKIELLKENELSEKTIDKFWKDLPSLLGLYIDNKKINQHAKLIEKMTCEAECKNCNICSKHKNIIKYNKKSIKIAKQNIDLIMKKINTDGL